jgi:hypothetical protein
MNKSLKGIVELEHCLRLTLEGYRGERIQRSPDGCYPPLTYGHLVNGQFMLVTSHRESIFSQNVSVEYGKFMLAYELTYDCVPNTVTEDDLLTMAYVASDLGHFMQDFSLWFSQNSAKYIHESVSKKFADMINGCNVQIHRWSLYNRTPWMSIPVQEKADSEMKSTSINTKVMICRLNYRDERGELFPFWEMVIPWVLIEEYNKTL